MDVMNDLVRIRDDGVGPQNLTIFLAKTTTKDTKFSSDSTAEQNSIFHSRLPTKTSNRSTVDLSCHLNNGTRSISRNATTHSSQLPPTLENPIDHVSRLPKMVPIRKTDSTQIAQRLKAQSSNARLTTDEREALISRILTSELDIQSKLDAQRKELFLSPKAKNIQRHATPFKPDRKDINQLMTSLMKKRLKIESDRAAQERLIFSPTVRTADQQKRFETVQIPAGKRQPYVRSGQPRLRATKQTKSNFGRSLTPIPETSELRGLDVAIGSDDEGQNRHNIKTIIDKENFRQQRMESELSSELLQDIETSLLLQRSDESDSLDELVIKDFAIRIVESEPDALTSSLPITEQVIQESNKLKEMMDSVKDRFQIKVARDKFAERRKQDNQPLNLQERSSVRPVPSQERNSIPENDKPTSSRTTPNILDSDNWGSVALPKPIFGDDVEPDSRGSDEDFLSERDMQFDDLFGVDNVSEPVNLRAIPLINNKVIGRTQRQSSGNFYSMENIEDLESPQFSDIPSDASLRSDSAENLNTSGNENPKFPSNSDYHYGTQKDSAVKQSKIHFEKPKQQQRERIDTAVETEHEKDIKKLKELIDSGTLTSSIVNQRFEEGVLDLLLRQSDSLWDPNVAGIPILNFIPSQNNERGLLDTSIKEKNLKSPLVQRPETKLPGYMEALENEWTKNNEKSDDGVADIGVDVVDDDENVLVRGLPKFSYEPPNEPEYLCRRKNMNIMDSKDEPNDDEDFLDDQEMNIDDLFDTVAEPTYDFQRAKIMDDLEIKTRIIRKMTEKSQIALRNHKSPSTQRTTQNQLEKEGNNLNIRKSVSFAGNVQGNDPSKHGLNARNETVKTQQENRTKSGEIKKWTTLNISEVKDLIEHARRAQAKHKGSRNN